MCTESLRAHRERRASVTKHKSRDNAPYGAQRSLHSGKLHVAAVFIQNFKRIKYLQQMLVMASMDWILFNEDIRFDVEN